MSAIKNNLKTAYQKLRDKNIKSPGLDAEILLSHVLKKTREYILAHPEKTLTEKQAKKYNYLINKRAQHVPVAYLINQKEFYGREFYVDERVLVPRPESELIIQNLELRNNLIIVDIGTGSGCIIITLAKELKNKNVKFFATDISKDALAVARKNARLRGVNKKIKFLQGNLLEPFLDLSFPRRRKSHKNCHHLIITANLPYLTPAEIKKSPSIKHEPKLALAAGKDGLKYYRELAKHIKLLQKKYPALSITLICEIGETQADEMKKIFTSVIPVKTEISIKKDLAGLDRILILNM